MQGRKVKLLSGETGKVVGVGHVLKGKDTYSVYMVELDKSFFSPTGRGVNILPVERLGLEVMPESLES